jgi:diguanylate cyclase (GGDEF)-like protein
VSQAEASPLFHRSCILSPESPAPLSLEAVLSSERLPSLPEVAACVVEIARNPDPDFDRLIEAIRIDPAIAGRILKTANSALLGMRTRAASVEQAVPRLGTTMVRTLVLSFCLAEYQNRNSLNLRPCYQTIWRESLTQAAVAESLAERQGGKVDSANWFLAGLLQDIGRLALLHTLREEYVEHVLEPEDERTHREREQQWLEFTHVEVSQGLCRRWNLDSEMIDAIGVHHASAHRVVPLKFVSSTSMPAALITAAHVAEYLEEVSHDLSSSREHIERLLMQVFALRSNDVFRVLADIDSRAGELIATFGIDVGRSPSLESILADAQELLGQIAMASQFRLMNAQPTVSRSSGSRTPLDSEADQTRDTRWRDQLTGTFNRAWLEPALVSVIDQAHQYQVPIGLLFVDLDHFSKLNDSIGTQAGDALLQKVASLLRQSIRLSDSVVRYSGDEFIVTLKDVNLDLLTLICDQIHSQIRTVLNSSEAAVVTCSIGAAFYTPLAGKTLKPEALIREADRAMSEARRKGGDQTVTSSFDAGSGKWIPQSLAMV